MKRIYLILEFALKSWLADFYLLALPLFNIYQFKKG